MATEQPAALTVYFDGGCPVCSREIAAWRRQAGADDVHWIDATRCDDVVLGTGLSRPQALARLHVRGADGRLVSGARAFTLLWQQFPRVAFLGRWLGRQPFVGLLELGYRASLVVRRTWRKRAT